MKTFNKKHKAKHTTKLKYKECLFEFLPSYRRAKKVSFVDDILDDGYLVYKRYF